MSILGNVSRPDSGRGNKIYAQRIDVYVQKSFIPKKSFYLL